MRTHIKIPHVYRLALVGAVPGTIYIQQKFIYDEVVCVLSKLFYRQSDDGSCSASLCSPASESKARTKAHDPYYNSSAVEVPLFNGGSIKVIRGP
jgi:hypothetical protein